MQVDAGGWWLKSSVAAGVLLATAASATAASAAAAESGADELRAICERSRAGAELEAQGASTLVVMAEAAEDAADDACASELWRAASRRHLDAAAYDASLGAAERSVGAARRSGGPVREASALLARGNAKFYRLDYADAGADFEAALRRLGAADEPKLRVAILQDLGITHANDGRPDLGLVLLPVFRGNV